MLKVKSAVKARNEFDLSFDHLTTLNFGQIVPLAAIEVVQGGKYMINGNFFSRLAPLAKPTYGKFQFKTVYGFVPYHQIADDADAWIGGKTVWEGTSPVPRYITLGNFAGFINTYCCTTTGATSSNSQYTYVASNGTVTYNLFTNEGKFFVKVLNALGYALPEGVNFVSGSTWYNGPRLSMKLNLYPFLAFMKLYNDYMSQSQRYNSSVLSSLLYKFKHGIADSTYWTASTGSVNALGLYSMIQNLKLNYENDYFTSAWQSPNNAINSQESLTSVNIPGTTNVVASDLIDNYQNLPIASNIARLSQRALDVLRSFDSWVKRNNYSGSRAVQQEYSRFGIKSDDYRSNYAHVLNTESMPVQVGDVTSVADTQGAILGDYSGKGIMSGSKGAEITVDDYGILLCLGYFTVSPMNAFGFDRMVLRQDPLDYYTPEFDGIGADAISYGEVYTDPTTDNTDTTHDAMVFGFTERYNSYRYGRDKITGEFREFRGTGMDTWHTGRYLTGLRTSNQLVAQSSSMNTLSYDDSEYNRIFSVFSSDIDHFYLTAKFTVKAILPMMNLNQVSGLGVGDTVLPRNGNTIS